MKREFTSNNISEQVAKADSFLKRIYLAYGTVR